MSQTANPIERFITATRRNCPERVRFSQYEVIVKRLKCIAEQMGFRIDVKIVYSAARAVEHVKISGVTWLIYDQYMAQSMNLLNRLFIEADSDHPAIVYFHKVLAERLVDVSRLHEALHCASFYHNSRDVLQPQYVDEHWRNVLTVTHEKFLLYHEFGHCIFSETDSLPVMREHVQFLIDHNVNSKKRSFDGALAMLKSAPPAAYHHQSLDEAIAELENQYSNKQSQHYTEALLAALAEAETKEEVFCDVLAADFCVHEARLDHIDVENTLRAIYIGFYHLQALEYIRRFPSLPAGTVEWAADNVPRVQARSHCLRAHLIFLYQIELSQYRKISESEADDLLEKFQISLMGDQKRYYDLIYDGAIGLCENLRKDAWIAELGQEAIQDLEEGRKLAGKSEMSSISADDLTKIVLILTGWFKLENVTT